MKGPAKKTIGRTEWIADHLVKGGGINRKVIQNQFGIARSAAMDTWRKFRAANLVPTVYDQSKKVHRMASDAQ